jgi:hypothetical protein
LSKVLEGDIGIGDALALRLVVEAAWVVIAKFVLANPMRVGGRLAAAAKVAAVVRPLLDSPTFTLAADRAFRYDDVRVRRALRFANLYARRRSRISV